MKILLVLGNTFGFTTVAFIFLNVESKNVKSLYVREHPAKIMQLVSKPNQETSTNKLHCGMDTNQRRRRRII